MTALAASPRRVLAWSAPVLLALIVLPFVVPPYQTVLLSYGLVFAIAALGFNLLLGYTGLLSFGHSAYFGAGAYAVAFIVKYGEIFRFLVDGSHFRLPEDPEAVVRCYRLVARKAFGFAKSDPFSQTRWRFDR